MSLESPAKRPSHQQPKTHPRTRPEPPRPTPSYPSAFSASVPRQLPAAVPYFSGREADLKALTQLAEQSVGQGGAVAVSAIGGTAGVGKSALVLHWGQQAADRFPDGQLYVNLRGFDPTGVPLETAAALRGFLGALGVPQAHLPVGLEEQAALYRSMLTGRRMLIVLDNARDPEQVRPLLPASAGILVLVTSRERLTGLVEADGARPLTVDLLGPEESRELLERRLGPERLAAEPEAVAQLVELCEGLPLALNIAAARASAYPDFPLSALAQRLRDARSRLSTLDMREATASVRAVISWSYQALSGPAARMFRLLGVHPGPDVTASAAADLADLPPDQTLAILDELARAHLVAEHVPGRYAFHNDLLRAYAAEQAGARSRDHQNDNDNERRSALMRMLEHYLSRARSAGRLLEPVSDADTPASDDSADAHAHPDPDPDAEYFADADSARAWLTAEYQVLLACVNQAAESGFDAYAWQLPLVFANFLGREDLWHDLADTLAVGVRATERLGDRPGQILAHRLRGLTVAGIGAYAEGYRHFSRAMELARAAGDQQAQGEIHLSIAWTLGQQGRYRRALHHGWRALGRYRAAGHRPGQAWSLDTIGLYHCRLGKARTGLPYSERAMEMLRASDTRAGEAAIFNTLGLIHTQLQRHGKAIDCLVEALARFRKAGDRYTQSTALIRLGDAQHGSGDREGARASWSEALEILESMQHPKAQLVRARLDRDRDRAERPAPGDSARADAEV